MYKSTLKEKLRKKEIDKTLTSYCNPIQVFEFQQTIFARVDRKPYEKRSGPSKFQQTRRKKAETRVQHNYHAMQCACDPNTDA